MANVAGTMLQAGFHGQLSLRVQTAIPGYRCYYRKCVVQKFSGHGGIQCTACHGSPHAMYPTNITKDDYQSKQYQGFTSRIKNYKAAVEFVMKLKG